MRLSVLSIFAGHCLLLASCAQPIANDQFDWEQGDRHGRVLEAVNADEGISAARTCLGTPPSAPGQAFVRVRYRRFRSHNKVVALVPAHVDVRPGDEVELRRAAGRVRQTFLAVLSGSHCRRGGVRSSSAGP